MLAELYDALRSAGADDAKARKAAEEVANYDNRLGKVETDLAVLKSMVGTVVALQVMTLAGIVGIVWRLVG